MSEKFCSFVEDRRGRTKENFSPPVNDVIKLRKTPLPLNFQRCYYYCATRRLVVVVKIFENLKINIVYLAANSKKLIYSHARNSRQKENCLCKLFSFRANIVSFFSWNKLQFFHIFIRDEIEIKKIISIHNWQFYGAEFVSTNKQLQNKKLNFYNIIFPKENFSRDGAITSDISKLTKLKNKFTMLKDIFTSLKDFWRLWRARDTVGTYAN